MRQLALDSERASVVGSGMRSPRKLTFKAGSGNVSHHTNYSRGSTWSFGTRTLYLQAEPEPLISMRQALYWSTTIVHRVKSAMRNILASSV
jgi:hypothetical protein